MVHIYSGWDHFPVVALAERGMMGIFRRRVWEYFESFLWSEKQERGEWVRMLWLVNRGDAGQQHVMLRILFQVSCCWRLFPGVLAAEEECEWQPGAGTEQQPAPVPAQSRAPRSVSAALSSQGSRAVLGMLSLCSLRAAPLPLCCWPLLIPCSSEYDFEMCHDESKLVRHAGRFHSWSPLREMLSLNYAQGMDFQVAFLSFFFSIPA